MIKNHKYNKNGQYLLNISYDIKATKLYIDPVSQNIYIYNSIGDAEPDYNLIKIYDDQGKLIDTYQAPKQTKLGTGIYVENGVIYSELDGKKIYEVKKINFQKEIKEEEKKIHIPHINVSLPTDYLNIVKVNLRSLKRQILSKKLPIKIPIKDEIILKLHDSTDNFYFKGLDKERNIYILDEVVEYLEYPRNRDNPDYEVRKYNLSGELIAEIKMRTQPNLFAGYVPRQYYIINSQGDIYELWRNKEEVYIIKWSKEE